MVNMGTVWDRTAEFLSDNLGAILPIALLTIFVPQTLSGLVQQAGAAVSPILSQGLPLLLMLPILWGQLLIAAFALDPDAGRGVAQSVAIRRFVPAVAATLILFGVIAVLAAPMLIGLIAGGVDLVALSSGNPGGQPALSPGLTTFVGLYFVVWIVATVFISIRFSALLFPVVAAQGGIVSALRMSFAAGRGITWKMIGVYLLFGLVFTVAILAVTTVFGALFRFLAPDAGPFGIGAIVVAILGGLMHMTYYAIVSAFSAKLYRAVIAMRDRA